MTDQDPPKPKESEEKGVANKHRFLVETELSELLEDNPESARRKRIWILGIPFLFILFISFLLWKDFEEDLVGRDGKGIATILEVKGKARRRPLDRFRWFVARPKRAVSVNESLITDKDSKIVLAFGSGTEIEIGETSLVTVQQKKGQIALNLKGGQIRFKSSPGHSKAAPLLQLHGKTLSIANGSKESQGTIGVSEQSASITIDSGEVTLTEGNKQENLEVKQSLQISTDGTRQVIQPSIVLKTPQPGEIFVSPLVDFSWHGYDSKSKESAALSLEIATTPNFARIWQALPVEGDHTQQTLPTGTYYWRLRVSPTQVSEARGFKILEKQALELIEPEDGFKVFLDNRDEETLFAWEPQEEAIGYTLTVASDPKFKTVIQALKLENQNRVFLNLRNQKKVFWKVESHFSSSLLASSSPTRSLVIVEKEVAVVRPSPVSQPQHSPAAIAEKEHPPTAIPTPVLSVTTSQVAQKVQSTPKLPSPTPSALPVELSIPDPEVRVGGLNITTNQSQKIAKRALDLSISWKPVPDALSYKVKVSAHRKMKPTEFEKDLKSTQVTLAAKRFPQHTVFIQVVAQMPNKKTVQSSVFRFKFEFLPPFLKSPADNEVVTQKGKNRGIILLTWSQTLFTDQFYYEFSPDPGFKKILQSGKLHENFLVMRRPPPGTYWWRVQALSPYFQSKKSKASSFKIP